MAKQPFYHRGDMHFSGETALDRTEIERVLSLAMNQVKGFVKGSAMIEVVAKPKKKLGTIQQCATFLFTATREVEASEVKSVLIATLGKIESVDTASVRVASFEEPEPGDPGDLD